MTLFSNVPKHLKITDTNFYPLELTEKYPPKDRRPYRVSLVTPNLIKGDQVLLIEGTEVYQNPEKVVSSDFTIGLSLEILQKMSPLAFPFPIKLYQTDSVKKFKLLSPCVALDGALAVLDETGALRHLYVDFIPQCTRG